VRPGSARIHVVRFAPAKLNLTLAVVGRREDGFHALHSIMVPLSIRDALTVSAAPEGTGRDTIRVSGLAVSTEPDNLVLRAIAATRLALAGAADEAAARPPQRAGAAAATEARPAAPAPAHAYLAALLSKRIPVAAGLGGGSSDAAAAIDAALAAWGVTATPARRLAIAATLGSDVPFFLSSCAALVTGRGERVEPLAGVLGDGPAVLLVTPGLPVATASVFAAYAAGARTASGRAREISESLAAELRSGVSSSVLLDRAADLEEANDLVPAALAAAPGLEEFVAALRGVLKRPVSQSGSGPTLWALYGTLAAARKAARYVRLAAVNGTLPRLGGGPPFIAATMIAGHDAPAIRPRRTAGPRGGAPT
jgi:4-diphosphocytidyl-2-C-methyl-D-erythritol kinase